MDNNMDNHVISLLLCFDKCLGEISSYLNTDKLHSF